MSSRDAGSDPAADGRTARRAVSRRRIEEAAAEMFAERGYTGSSLDDIAHAAGVSKGTIFYNYKNKAELFEHLMLGSVTAIAGDVVEAHRGRRGWPAFEAATLRVIERVEENPTPALIVLNELFRTGQPWAPMLHQARDVLVEPLVTILREVSDERIEHARAAGLDAAAAVEGHDAFAALAMSVLGALVVATLDRRAFAPQRSNAEVHRALLQAVSGMRDLGPLPEG